jgi:hypothetical protein
VLPKESFCLGEMAQGGRVPLHYQAVDAVFRLNTVIKNKLLGILRERQEGPPNTLQTFLQVASLCL